MDPDLELRRLSGREFDAMCGIGMFADEHVELLRGVLVAMSPQNEPHARVTAWLAQVLIRALSFDAYDVRTHSTYAPAEDSRPEPDVSVFRRERARASLPTEALLVIEVSDTSLRKERKVKLPLYAAAGVPEYWIVDVSAGAVEVYVEPGATGYARAAVHRAGDVLAPRAVPGVAIPVAAIPFEPRA